MLTSNGATVRSCAYPAPAHLTAVPGSPYGSPYGSYKPAVQVAIPTVYHMGNGPAPSYTMPSPTTLLNSKKPPSLHNADKESCADGESWLDDEKFGGEEKGASEEYTLCGVDLKPVLPLALAMSTVLGGICVLLFQVPLLARLTFISETVLYAGFGTLYVVTVLCMTYCYFADPGQVRKTRRMKIGEHSDVEQGLPQRAHKSWQYDRPIRRYDHYCKWLQNVIGLLNHREFVVMVGGLVVIAVLGMVVDVWLGVLIGEKGMIKSDSVA
eukprot:Skav207941  [mRNA]  locus=scaffold108:220712:221515:+ [translate_table: standard]